MTSIDIALPAWPVSIVRTLLQTGTQAWLAGGAVRDLLLAHSPHDWDFVVTGSGLHLARVVADMLGGAYYALDHERQTGRAIVLEPASGHRITLDFAALRDDTIVQDLLARDFTLNAMALSLDGQLIDPTDGHLDLMDRRLRMVSSGCFSADSIRLLRAARQSTQLGLTIEEKTRARIQAEAPAIATAAPERVRAELVVLMALPAAAAGLALLRELGLLEHVLPELSGPPISATALPAAELDETSRRIAVVATLVRLQQSLVLGAADPMIAAADLPRALTQVHPDVLQPLTAYLAETVGAEVTRGELIRWAALFVPSSGADTAAERTAERRMSELHFSRAAIDFVRRIAASVGAFRQLVTSRYLTRSGREGLPAARRAVYRYFRGARETGVAAAILALASYRSNRAPQPAEEWQAYVDTARILIEAYLTQRTERVDPPPLLSGHDLLALGVPPGTPVGDAVALLREAQATGEVQSEAQARAFVLHMLRRPEGDDRPSCGESL